MEILINKLEKKGANPLILGLTSCVPTFFKLSSYQITLQYALLLHISIQQVFSPSL